MGHAPHHATHDAAHLGPGQGGSGCQELAEGPDLVVGGEDVHLGRVTLPPDLAAQVLQDVGVGGRRHGVEASLVLPGVAVVVGEDFGGDDLIGQLRLPDGAEAAASDDLDQSDGWGGGVGRAGGGGGGGGGGGVEGLG